MTSSDYVLRRQKLRKDIGSGTVLIFGNKLIPRNYTANTYPFRQDSNFLYYTGLNIPGCCLAINCDSGNEILFGYDPTIEDSIWSGPQDRLEDLANQCGIKTTRHFHELNSFIESELSLKNPIHYLPPYPHERQLFLGECLQKSNAVVIQEASKKLILAVISQREVKSANEVSEIENTLSEITGPMHIAAMKMALPGVYEYEVIAEMQRIAALKQSEFAYGPICTVHGETLHNIVYENELKQEQFLLIDAGVESPLQYATDITRTTPVGGKFSDQQRNIYTIVLKAQLQAIQSIRPGISYSDIHRETAITIASGLTQLGLMKGSPEEIVQQGAHALFFPHGLGHMMGLDVHDMEDLGEELVGYNQNVKRSEQFGTAYLRLGRELKAGFVITVEPGIYFIPALIDQWENAGKFSNYINYSQLKHYLNFGGVRIEDNILLTENGQRVLGKAIPKEPDELENLFSQ